ncbi:sigma-54-dependent transcriptional regulator [Candidatus Aalborgicola defluviihabitans]|mgnify:CR=1 FL=1|uniref:sigma-54-dependent transcriptional regulator n=1 Tax=Candidatus Aalborgicola defluviihabitans TaxID=3386187 RepID=UPI001DB4642C|nr:sigma-54-dependent Fis family transcriptional regulator [Burkholderiales bacterium]MBK6570832.1 sigma-54-dependent Fis family transcriptional regulator [Burkholderiales bacterium]MBK7279825.1 sigma-54-dependent Fis family transcriptional regulator [Burkholderiales bacterium]MBK7312487.1 sigma-54-dependent Fis family transcriptional regulator [Burkholderiales bacterium]MBL0243297.1 sigma-54-dependent Fis family transcriptional regulator [Rhodoferax sp.]
MATQSVLNNAQILVIDDEPDLRTLYELTLLREGYRVDTAGSVQDAMHAINTKRFDVIITDMRLPDGLGTEILQHMRAGQRPERCIVITAHGSAENAVESLKAGAFDYLTKPVDLKQFRAAIASAVHGTRPTGGLSRRATDARLQENPACTTAGQNALAKLAGESNSMRVVKERIAKVARSMAPVLIQGESGTGKELVASALHANSHRATGPWVAVNCSAIPENLLETEFFGAKKGAYTGSVQDREGFFQAAKGGTLFLDEIGDLPLAMQSKLLRAIQERTVRPVGSTQEEPVDVRIVSATHKSLPEEVQAGRFRQDLFYRLNVIDIVIPPLRERYEDLPALCSALLQRISDESDLPAPKLAPGTLEQLCLLPLYGNVRELENLLHRAVALCDGDCLRLDDIQSPINNTSALDTRAAALPSTSPDAPLPTDLQAHLDQQERDILVKILKETGFNRTVAAARLGLSLRQIRYRIARLKIDAPGDADPDA